MPTAVRRHIAPDSPPVCARACVYVCSGARKTVTESRHSAHPFLARVVLGVGANVSEHVCQVDLAGVVGGQDERRVLLHPHMRRVHPQRFQRQRPREPQT